jgi:hypothetical protein
MEPTRVHSARNSQPTDSGNIHIGDERRRSDRREEPTRPWSRLLGGPYRRARGRRLTDQADYVDLYTRQDIALLLAIFLLNVGDAFFTMLWLSRGGGEANPVMDFFLDIGPGAFIIQKCFVVGLWLVVLLVHKNFRFARLGLYAALAVYSLLMIVHFGIIAFGISPEPELKDVEMLEFRGDMPIQNASDHLDISALLEEN